jgi:hypothetical protein
MEQENFIKSNLLFKGDVHNLRQTYDFTEEELFNEDLGLIKIYSREKKNYFYLKKIP